MVVSPPPSHTGPGDAGEEGGHDGGAGVGLSGVADGRALRQALPAVAQELSRPAENREC